MTRVLGAPVGGYLPALGLAVAAAGYLAVAYGYPPEARAVPAMVAWGLIALLALDLASRSETRVGRALTRWLNPAAEPAPAGAGPSPAASLAAILWVAGFAAALVLIGILCAVPLYVFGAMRWRGRRRFLACLAGGVGATLLVWLLFAVVLRLELYRGVLFGGT